jgi:hypothetical protein
MNYLKMFNWKNLLVNLIFIFILPILPTVVIFKAVLDYKPELEETIRVEGEQRVKAISTEIEINTITKEGMSFNAEYQDYRAYVLDKYFAINHSPLSGYGNAFIAACDKYNAPQDCTLIPAIAYVETGLCTLGISQAQFNCWGWGGSGPNRILFKDYNEAIDTITKGMVDGYGTYMTKPDRIVNTYCGPHCVNWAKGVTQERNKLNRMSKELYLPALF